MNIYIKSIFFLSILFICIYIFFYKSEYKILTSIVSIDRDSDLSQKLYDALLKNNVEDILIVTRETDQNTIKFWKDKSKIITVPHYEITDRHNLDKLVEKRQLVIDYAKNKYDAIWFVDSDIIPTQGVLDELIKTNKDICLAPYRVKWYGTPCVGIDSKEYPFVKLHEINQEDKKETRKPCIIGGFGCTLIKKTAFNIKIENKKLENSDLKVHGEDLGFFINCYNAGITCEYLPNFEQPHLFKV